jgi:hypothetical protein
MAFHPDDSDWDDREDEQEAEPFQGQVRHSNVSARVPESVGQGVFSNGVMILTGAFEIVLDFVLRMGEQQRVVTRIILPHTVARQFVAALKDNVGNYERRFGPVPKLPRPLPETPPQAPEIEYPPSADPPAPPSTPSEDAPDSGPPLSEHPENRPVPPAPPQIEDIYHDLKLPDEMLSGRYANAVLIRHSGTEFCFDFITNLYPRSAVSSRVFLAAPHVLPFLHSLHRSITPPQHPGTSQGLA